MTNPASKLYDQATDTVHDWVETVRDELPDISDVKSAAGDITDRAGDLWEDAADRVMALLPGAAARAARSRRRRWMLGGIAVIGVALLFGPGGAKRRSAVKKRLKRRLGGESPTRTHRPVSAAPDDVSVAPHDHGDAPIAEAT